MAQVRQQVFWHELARGLSSKRDLPDALQDARAATDDTYLSATVNAVSDDVRAGTPLSESLRRYPEVFPLSTIALVEAAESCGVVDLAVESITRALADGSLTASRPMKSQIPDNVRFWRLFAHLVSVGIPILHVLSLLSAAVESEHYRQALREVGNAIREGDSFIAPLRSSPELMPEQIATSLEGDDEPRELDTLAMDIAHALETGDYAAFEPLSADEASGRESLS